MKILIADVLLHGRPHSDWKEGYELCYAFRSLGHECDVYGPYGNSELLIESVAKDYDLAIITENYPGYSGWKWWSWENIKIPKLFWAIDTHVVNFMPWIKQAKIDFVAFNNPQDLEKYNIQNSFWMPYAASKKHQMIEYSNEKKRDIVFIGSMSGERQRICEKHNIECLNVYGPEYIKEMQSSKICFNQSSSYDINAKYFEILASGSFMLTNYNEHFHRFLDFDKNIEKMFYRDEEELERKIFYYLRNEEEREEIAKDAKMLIYENHTWENRANLILDRVKKNA